MTAAAIQSIFGDSSEVKDVVDDGPSKAERRQVQAEAKAADRAARMQAKAEAKAARAEEKAAAKAARDEDRAAAKAAKLAAREAQASDDDADEEMRARAKVDEAEAKAAAKLERQAEIQARREAKAAAKLERQAEIEARREAKAAAKAARKQPTTEPDVDDSDGSERPIAVAAKLQQDHEDAEQREREAREAKERAKQAKREAAEARKAQKAELAAARQKEHEEAAAAKAAAKAEREGAKAAVRLGAASTDAAEDDHIVEPPREPKKSLIDRLRPEPTDQPGDDEDARSTLVPTLAVVLGALGFVFSVVLAIGAFMVALNPQDDGGLFNVVSNVCDALVGPLRGLFSFSGVNGESKEALVAWGLGALGYLVLGLFAQSFLRSRSEDD
ncbi:hypothetical protein [Aeromicrobium sp.]|uniref:hypothetical protein n=1 Tax=Aeromicrobium sp. TaxID=1871063 RepID=UPI002FC9E9EB